MQWNGVGEVGAVGKEEVEYCRVGYGGCAVQCGVGVWVGASAVGEKPFYEGFVIAEYGGAGSSEESLVGVHLRVRERGISYVRKEDRALGKMAVHSESVFE